MKYIIKTGIQINSKMKKFANSVFLFLLFIITIKNIIAIKTEPNMKRLFTENLKKLQKLNIEVFKSLIYPISLADIFALAPDNSNTAIVIQAKIIKKSPK